MFRKASARHQTLTFVTLIWKSFEFLSLSFPRITVLACTFFKPEKYNIDDSL